MVSRGARIALVIAPARAPLINSRTSLLSKKSCTTKTIQLLRIKNEIDEKESRVPTCAWWGSWNRKALGRISISLRMAYTSPNIPLLFWWWESEERVLVSVFDDILLLFSVLLGLVRFSFEQERMRLGQMWNPKSRLINLNLKLLHFTTCVYYMCKCIQCTSGPLQKITKISNIIQSNFKTTMLIQLFKQFTYISIILIKNSFFFFLRDHSSKTLKWIPKSYNLFHPYKQPMLILLVHNFHKIFFSGGFKKNDFNYNFFYYFLCNL